MNYIDEVVTRYPSLMPLRGELLECVEAFEKCYHSGGKILIAGNGGSCADSEHISGELLKGFILKRPPEAAELEAFARVGLTEEGKLLQRGIPSVPLSSLCSVLSAFANDVAPDMVFGQLVYALGGKNDVLLCLSTSGNSRNVVKAAQVARAMGIYTVALTGSSGGELFGICDLTLRAPASETYKVQELHLPIYHALCAELEARLFG